jgi:hypothetical protein
VPGGRRSWAPPRPKNGRRENVTHKGGLPALPDSDARARETDSETDTQCVSRWLAYIPVVQVWDSW